MDKTTGIKSDLVEIVSSLTTSELAYAGNVYIKVIQDGVLEMTQGRISAKPISERRFPSPESIDQRNLHLTYALFYEDDRVGQILISSFPLVGRDVLKRGVEVSLDHYPTDRTVVLGRKTDFRFNTDLKKTKYDDIYLGPSLPVEFSVH